jgi:hypothetical protein
LVFSLSFERKKMVLGDLTSNLISRIIGEFRKEENQRRLKCHVLDPTARYLENRLKPYFFTLLIVLLVMVGLLLWMLRLALRLSGGGAAGEL